MKNTAKFRRSLRYLWMESRLGPVIWIDEMAHLTEKQWKTLSAALDPIRQRDCAWMMGKYNASSWVTPL